MNQLIALALEGGPSFVDALQRVWANGDAAFPLDLRLPAQERRRVLAAVAPGAIIESDGEQRHLDGGKPVEPGDALVVATSGTTGNAKGVVHTHEGLLASAVATSSALNVDPHRDEWLACLPLAHVGGLSVVTRAILTDTPLVVQPRFEVAAAIEAARNGCTLVSLVTRTLNQIDPALFRTVVIGGAAPPAERPTNVIATYGMTETGSGVVYDRRRLDGVEIEIDDADEIWLRGPMLLRTYRSPLDQTDIDPKTSDGWFATGDLGRLGQNDELQVFGRRGDVIVTGGEKVWPARVEPLLNQQPGVAEAMVIGRPHPEWGHEVVAVVVAEPSQEPSLAQVRSAIKAELPAWYAPQSIQIVGQLPKTALGKIKRTPR